MTRVYFDGRDLEFAIRRGGIERVYPLTSLAAVLRIETAHLRARIDSLLNAGELLSTETGRTVPSRDLPGPGTMMEEEPTEMVVVGPDQTTPKKNRTHPNHGLASDQTMEAPMVRPARERIARPRAALDAAAIVRVLGPDANDTAIASLIEGVPESILRDALEQTLGMPNERLRTHPAALFTAIVRRLIAEASKPSTPYARTETPAT